MDNKYWNVLINEKEIYKDDIVDYRQDKVCLLLASAESQEEVYLFAILTAEKVGGESKMSTSASLSLTAGMPISTQHGSAGRGRAIVLSVPSNHTLPQGLGLVSAHSNLKGRRGSFKTAVASVDSNQISSSSVPPEKVRFPLLFNYYFFVYIIESESLTIRLRLIYVHMHTTFNCILGDMVECFKLLSYQENMKVICQNSLWGFRIMHLYV